MRMRLRWNMWGEKKYDEIKEQKIRSNWWYNQDEIKKSEKILLDSDFSIIVGSFLPSHRNVGICLEWIMNSTCFGAASPIPGQDQVPEVWDTHPIFAIGVSPRSHPTTSHAMHTHTRVWWPRGFRMFDCVSTFWCFNHEKLLMKKVGNNIWIMMKPQ